MLDIRTDRELEGGGLEVVMRLECERMHLLVRSGLDKVGGAFFLSFVSE